MEIQKAEVYELDLEGDTWILYRHNAGSPQGYQLEESKDINDIFKRMFKDKASRGRGSTMRIGWTKMIQC